MTRKQLLSELYKEYDNIYEFTGNFGDEPLNILDQFLIEAGLSTENEYIWDEKLADGLRFLRMLCRNAKLNCKTKDEKKVRDVLGSHPFFSYIYIN